jgi:hypothetical protein
MSPRDALTKTGRSDKEARRKGNGHLHTLPHSHTQDGIEHHESSIAANAFLNVGQQGLLKSGCPAFSVAVTGCDAQPAIGHENRAP